MGVVSFKHGGDFKNLEKFFKGYNTQKMISILERYGQEGIQALASATPVDSGLTASSWGYRTSVSRGSFFIMWTNNNMTSNGTPLVILLQYGHGTKNGGFVQGKEFINSAIQPVMDKIANAVWQEVRSL